ncbi:MAG TPA: hypothetical protein VE309_10385 [Caulobacteraceae bacterium]|nr:hypothetical protein [Caulobacteraceae bacterium]
MVGGLVVSQLLTLFTTPVIYLRFDSLERRLSRRGPNPRKGESDPDLSEAEPDPGPAGATPGAAPS